MNPGLPQPLLDRLFRVGITIKGIDGMFEVLGGCLLLVVPVAKLQGAIATLALHEIANDRHAFIAKFVLNASNKLDPHIQLFAVIYLLGHGTIKIFLAIALLRRHFRLYPYAIGFLLAFILYQAYRIGYDHSVALTALTLFDCAIAWLTYLEWQRHRKGASAE
jgi:uncharacterized membrane protein